MSCGGDGSCFDQVDLNQYSQKECSYNCQLSECHNFKLCGNKRPKWVLNCNNDMCLDCAGMIGKIKFLHIKDDCPICMENKDMIEVSCEKHNVCIDCWKQMSATQHPPLKCPLCRRSIWSKS